MKKLLLILMLGIFLLSFTSAFNWSSGTLTDYWRMDGVNSSWTGTKNAHTGIYDRLVFRGTNGASITDGILGNAINFSTGGNGNYSSTNGSRNLNTTFTYNFWINVKLDASVGVKNAILNFDQSLGGDSGAGLIIPILGNGTLYSQYLSTNSYSNVTIANETDTMITLVSNGTKLAVYISGTLAKVDERGTNEWSALYLATPRQNIQPTYGWYDEIGLWNTNLSQDNITELYNEGRALGYNESVLTNYGLYVNSRQYNSSTFETKNESFTINVSDVGYSYSSISAVLYYNGSKYTPTKSTGTNYTYFSHSLDVPLGGVTQNWNWTFTLVNSTGTYTDIYSGIQEVEEIIFTLCNATYTNNFLNISFKDEADLSVLNATLPYSSFVYYLGSGLYNKTYTLTNNTENLNYEFCATPDKTFHIDPYVQYASTGYPQRIWNPSVTDYTSTVTNQVLYLLSSADGLYVTLQVVNSADQVLSGVSVNATRSIGGSDVEVGQGLTGDDGTVTFWLNPDFSHTFMFTKTGFTDYTTTFTPTQSSYTITMAGGGVTPSSDYTRGINTYILPIQNELFNDTTYSFEFNVTSSYWDLDSFGFSLRLSNGTIVGTDSSTVSGTPATLSYDVNNQSIIYMDYYWIIEGNTTSGTKYWVITNTNNTGWSIKTFFTDLTTYLDSGIFGIDSFGRTILIFLLLFISVGIMSYKFGLINPMAVSSMIFAIIFFLDVVVGLIPQIRGISYLLTYVAGLILMLSIFREVSR